MIAIRLAKAAACILFIVPAVQVHYLCALASANAQAAPSLQEFFQTLVQHYDPSSLPKYEDVLKVVDQIGGAPAKDITKALPAIFVALAHQDDNIKIDAALALFAVSQRSDSAELLRSRIDAIGHDLLTSANPDARAGEIVILGSLKPLPPPEVLPIFLTFLKRTDGDAQAQGSGVIFELVHIAPENPEVIAAVQEFLSRPLDSSSRIGVLNALGDPRVKDVHVIAMVIASLDDPDKGIKLTATQALMRMGPHALRQAEPALQRLTHDPSQPSDVAAAAKEALQHMHPRNNNK